jgi:integrase
LSKVKFNLKSKNSEDSSINLVLHFNYQKIKVSTGQKVRVRYWNDKTQRVRDHYDYVQGILINSELDRQGAQISKYLNQIKLGGYGVTADDLRNDVKSIISGTKIQVSEMTFWEHFDAFVEYKRTRVTKDVIKDYHNSLRKHLLACELLNDHKMTFESFRHQADGFFDRFEHYLIYEVEGRDGTPGFAVNTVGKLVKNLKSLLNWAFDRGLIQRYSLKHMVTRTEEADTIYLSSSEIDRIEEVELDDVEDENVRDLFLIGCETGLRFGDFTSLEEHHIHGRKIRKHQNKTSKMVVIPISARVGRILDRHKNNLPEVKNVTDFNARIRSIAERAGIIESTARVRQKGNQKVTQIFEKWEMVTSHTARRSFCTNKFLAEMPVQAIMQFSGHKSERTFMRYLKIDSEMAAEKYAEFF